MGLKERLQLFGLKEKVMDGDGNCQFRALADQMYGSQERHREVRATVVKMLRAEPDAYAAFVCEGDGDTYEEYCANMSRDGTWGDAITMQAAADAYGVKVRSFSHPLLLFFFFLPRITKPSTLYLRYNPKALHEPLTRRRINRTTLLSNEAKPRRRRRRRRTKTSEDETYD